MIKAQFALQQYSTFISTKFTDQAVKDMPVESLLKSGVISDDVRRLLLRHMFAGVNP